MGSVDIGEIYVMHQEENSPERYIDTKNTRNMRDVPGVLHAQVYVLEFY